MIPPSSVLPTPPRLDAPAHEWRAYRDAVGQAARHVGDLSWSRVEHLTASFAAGGRHATFPTRTEWGALLAAFRANPGWQEDRAVEYVAHLVSSADGVRPGLRQVDRWPGMGRLLADTPVFADRVRVDHALHDALWQCASPALDALSDGDTPRLVAWPRFAAQVLVRAGTEDMATLRHWRRQLMQRVQSLTDAAFQYAHEEGMHAVIPPRDLLFATLVGREAPSEFAEAVRETLERQPLVAVLALAHATADQWAAMDRPVVAQVLALSPMASRWRVALLTAAGQHLSVAAPARRAR